MTVSERRRAILIALCNRRFDRRENLANEFGVSKRTIDNDVLYLSLTYPVYTSFGRNGGNYPESYIYGEAVTISALKSSFNCGGPGSNYHSGGGSGNAGYAFKGWYLDNRCTVPFDGTISAGTYGDITLYADITSTYTHNY